MKRSTGKTTAEKERKNGAKGLENNGWETVTEKRADEITDKIMTK